MFTVLNMIQNRNKGRVVWIFSRKLLNLSLKHRFKTILNGCIKDQILNGKVLSFCSFCIRHILRLRVYSLRVHVILLVKSG